MKLFTSLTLLTNVIYITYFMKKKLIIYQKINTYNFVSKSLRLIFNMKITTFLYVQLYFEDLQSLNMF